MHELEKNQMRLQKGFCINVLCMVGGIIKTEATRKRRRGKLHNITKAQWGRIFDIIAFKN